jgi:radical SAM protein with 4Fe4S-binding SPASM domain
LSQAPLNSQDLPQVTQEKRLKHNKVQIIFINIDFLGIGNPCNNSESCIQCFLGNIAKNKGDYESDKGTIKKVMDNYPNASFFFYPPEFKTNTEYLQLMKNTGQKAMTNGKAKGISEKIITEGFMSVSFPLYSDLSEMRLFYGYNETEYDILKENIMTSASAGLEVEVFSIVTPLNYEKLPSLYALAEELCVKKISLMPLVPLGKAKDLRDGFYLDQEILGKVIDVTEGIKKQGGPYLSLGYGFGPNKSAAERFSEGNESWVKTKTLCPAINGGYAAINVSEKNAYWCFKALNEPWGQIGSIDEDGKIILNKIQGLGREDLIDNLEGMCEDCDMKEYCLGGCRSQAVAFALRENPALPFEKAIYSGQPFCRYKLTTSQAGL